MEEKELEYILAALFASLATMTLIIYYTLK
jgi:hypothetical protein